jgi:hypothetical protein
MELQQVLLEGGGGGGGEVAQKRHHFRRLQFQAIFHRFLMSLLLLYLQYIFSVDVT